MIGSRFLLIPVLAAVGYEVLRLGARFRRFRLVQAIMFPGILVQMITTKRPTDDMIEVAITSMEEALTADGNQVPAGSTDFDRSPLEPAKPADEPRPPDSVAAAEAARTPDPVGAASPGESPPLT